MASNGLRVYRLHVSNIPWTVSHFELRQYFSKFGPVSLANVVFNKKTGLSKSFGFVQFGNKEGFENAQNFHPHKLEGQTLRVQAAQE